ncbi:MAG: hypothetical protein HOE90_06350 [Bacteriovoracaceae bacterium]|nr:hypothetical protein [Bacteriovoracaceae bacterium]
MEANSPFKLVRGESRNTSRNQKDDNFGMLFINKEFVSEVEILELKHGELIIKTSSPISPDTDSLLDIEILQDEEVYFNGKWEVNFIREDNGNIYSIKNSKIDKITNLLYKFNPRLFLNPSSYRIFDLKNEVDNEEIACLFTGLKDCLYPVKISLLKEGGSNKQLGSLDFGSNSSSIDFLSIDIFDIDRLKLETGSEIELQFNYLSVSYIFSTKVKEIDKDFGEMDIFIPETIIATTGRIFLRHHTNIKVKAHLENEEMLEATMKSISISGALIEIAPQQTPLLIDHQKLLLELPNNTFINAEIKETRKNNIGLMFANENLEIFKKIREIIVNNLSSGLVQRTRQNYKEFLELYKKVGYCDSTNEFEWEETTQLNWEQQDKTIPGNCFGKRVEDDLVASVGTLPISENTIYGHSACMLKNLESIESFLKLINIGFDLSYLIPQIKNYAGSYRRASRFTSRLVVVFDGHAAAKKQKIVNLIRIKASKEIKPISKKFNLEKISSTEFKESTATNKEISNNLTPTNNICKDMHTQEYYKIYDDNNVTIGTLIKNNSRENFTASDILNYSWLFTSKENINDDLIHSITNIFQGCGLYVCTENFREIVKCEEIGIEGEDLFWTITELRECGPVVSSIAKAIYSVLKKYGDESLSQMSSIM